MLRCSAVLIALDEGDRIALAVRSALPWVDEVLVLDGGSRDDTRAAAEAAGARVLEYPFDGFVAQKQRATDLAQHDLVFALDADEQIDDELGRGIQAARVAAAESAVVGWQVRRRNYLDGQPLKASGWYPDLRVRLFDRRHGSWAGSEPHDRVEVRGNSDLLPGHLHHDPGRTSEQFRRGTAAHARRRATSLASGARRITWWTPWLRGFGHLLRKLLIGTAWRDGRRGWTVASVGALGVVAKYRLAARQRAETGGT